MQPDQQGGMEVLKEIHKFSAAITASQEELDEKVNELMKVEAVRDEKKRQNTKKHFHKVIEGTMTNATYNRIEEKNCEIEDIKIRGLKRELSLIRENRKTLFEKLNLWKKANFSV